jgi:hypothetical protein
MLEVLREVLKSVWWILIIIPMPWRSVFLLSIFIMIIPWILLRLVPNFIYFAFGFLLWLVKKISEIILFPEFKFSQGFITKRETIPKLVYIIGDSLFFVIDALSSVQDHIKNVRVFILKKKVYIPKFWMAVAFWILLSLFWYSRPLFVNSDLGKLTDSSNSWFYSLERWIVTNKWEYKQASPEQFVKQYFSYISKGEISTAWNHTTQNFKNNTRLMPNGFNSYKDWWSNKDVQIVLTSIESRGFDNAKVMVIWKYKNTNTKSNYTPKKFILFLVFDDKFNKWLLDNSTSS